jgi:hypothetical protein
MKLDPGIHVGMHLVWFSKTRCDKIEPTKITKLRTHKPAQLTGREQPED